jgi:hypothetical protein
LAAFESNGRDDVDARDYSAEADDLSNRNVWSDVHRTA